MTIYPNDTYQCLLLNDLDEDWYQVTFYKEGIGEFALSCERPEDAELKMEFAFRADSGEILPLSKESLVCAGGQTVCKLLWDVTAGTTYFVRVSGDSGNGSAGYTLKARLSPLSPLRNEALLAQLGPSATVEGFYHRPFEELPQALRDRLTFVREEANAYGFAMILREYAAPGITVTTSQATEEGLRRWLDGQLSLPEGNEERSGTDEELRAEFEREKGREWLYSVDITDDSYATDFGLKVGATIEEAEALGYLFPLGQPLTTNGSAAYGDTWNHQLIIYTENGVVTKLSLNWGIGRYAGKYWDP